MEQSYVSSYTPSVEEVHQEPKKAKPIITIILAIFIVLLFGYNIYVLFIAKPNNNPEEEKIVLTQDQKLATVKIVPYVMGATSAYADMFVKTDTIDRAVFASMVINELKKDSANLIYQEDDSLFNDFNQTNCPDATTQNCYAIKLTDFQKTLVAMYGPDTNFKDGLFVLNNKPNDKCYLENNYYFCNDNIEASLGYTGKLSVVQVTKESDTEITVYENVLFVDNAIVTQNDNLYNVSVANIYKNSNSTSLLGSNINLVLTNENYTASLMNNYQGNVFLYKHIFKKTGDTSYYWYSSEPVSDVNQ